MTDEKKFQSYTIPNGEFGPRTFILVTEKRVSLI